MTHNFTLSLNRSSSNNKKKIYKFQYETSRNIKIFHGCLSPLWNYSVISLERLKEHGLDVTSLTLKPITRFTFTRGNKLENIVGICELTILFENNGGIRVGRSPVGNELGGGIGETSPFLFSHGKVEKKIREVLVLKESDMEFRLGNDFITDYNIVIEPKGRSGNDNEKFTHQLRFEDGVTVDLKEIEIGDGKSLYAYIYVFIYLFKKKEV